MTGISWGRPLALHPDEWVVIKNAIDIVRMGNLEPVRLDYPTLLTYAVTPVVWAVHAATGLPLDTTVQGLGQNELLPSQFPYLLAGRLVVAAFGTFTIPVVAAAAWLLGGRAAAVAAALVTAMVPLAVEHSHYLTTDVPIAFFVAAATALTLGALRTGRFRILSRMIGTVSKLDLDYYRRHHVAYSVTADATSQRFLETPGDPTRVTCGPLLTLSGAYSVGLGLGIQGPAILVPRAVAASAVGS